uniref:TRC8-like N-terminal domain-containing protein n=1 Tax=Ciona savignyi TaxID=51511 RepID=H2Y7Y6_CIOSA
MIPWLACNFTCDVLVVLLKASVCISLAVLVGYLVQIAAVLHNHMKQLIFKSNTIVALFGWQGVVEWARGEYQIQTLLITCWCLRYGVQVYANLHKQLELNTMGSDVFKVLQIDLWDILNKTQYSTILLIAVVQCMNTSINLFGFVCIVKEVIKFQYFLIRSWLHCSFTDHPPDSVSGPLTGAIDGITFLIMS